MAALYVVATPIGNLQDFSPRAAETMKDAVKLRNMEVRTAGEDFCITGYPEYTAQTYSEEDE